MSGSKCQCAIGASAVAKTFLEVFVSAHAHRAPEKRDQHGPQHQQNANGHKTRHELVPVVFISRARISDERDTADDGSEDGKAHGPVRNGAARDKISLGGVLPAREMKPDPGNATEIDGDNNKIQPAEVHAGKSSKVAQISNLLYRRIS